jgi:uncharacterized protein
MTIPLDKKLDNLRNILKEMNNIIVGYSGGVDSTFLLTIAKQVLDDKVQAITISSPLIPKNEIKEAVKIAEMIDVPHQILTIDILTHPHIKNNSNKRCYYCKKIIFTHLQQLAKQHTTKIIIEGSTTDDTKEYRPGRKALKELNIRSPLMETGFTKQDIRTLSKHMGLPTWNKPASPCLATRIPYNTTLTTKKLNQVSQAETYLKTLGFTIVRVRHHHNLARIEVPKKDIPTLIQHTGNIYKNLKKIGYHYITIDLNGYKRGCYDGEKNL